MRRMGSGVLKVTISYSQISNEMQALVLDNNLKSSTPPARRSPCTHVPKSLMVHHARIQQAPGSSSDYYLNIPTNDHKTDRKTHV